MRLDVAMRHRPRQGHAVKPPPEDVGCRGYSGDVERARSVHCRIDPMYPPRPKIHHWAAVRSGHETIRLRGQHRLQLDLIQDEGFDELRLWQRRGDLHDRLPRKHWSALADCPDVSSEAKAPKPAQEAAAELPQ